MRFKMAYDAVTLTIFFESSKNGSFILRMALASIVYYQHVCVSGSNYIHMHIGFEWVLWIHLHKELWFIAANNRVPQKCNLTLSQSDSYITHVMAYFIIGWSVKFTPLLGLWGKVLSTFILKDIFNRNSPWQMELSRDVIWIIWEFSQQCCSMERLLDDICDSKAINRNSS